MVKTFVGLPGPWAAYPREPSDHYTTKIGGLPDWPCPLEVIKPNFLDCGVCGSKLCLVAQVYAPISSTSLRIEERTLYVFGCIMPKCESASLSWRAIRVQKSQEEDSSHVVNISTKSSSNDLNSIWRDSLDDDSDDCMDMEELGKALSDAASLACEAKKSHSNQHYGTVIKQSPSRPVENVLDIKMSVMPCFYIITEEESCRGEISIPLGDLKISNEKIDGEINQHEEEESWVGEEYEYDKALNADRTYLKFKKRLDACPEQCFRYSYGGKPILALAEEKGPGKCELCGGLRHFEMQLMPSLHYFLLEAADDSQKQSLDRWNWMTLMIYTCSKSCSVDCGNWMVAEEAVLMQLEEPLTLENKV